MQQVLEIEVNSYAPIVGELGVEGILLRQTNGELCMLTGPVVGQLIGAPTNVRRRSPSAVASATESLSCPECGKVLRNSQGLSHHLMRTHGIASSKRDRVTGKVR